MLYTIDSLTAPFSQCYYDNYVIIFGAERKFTMNNNEFSEMWRDPTTVKDKFALISKSLIDMPLDDKNPNHINLIKFGAKVAINAMKACGKKGKDERHSLIDSMETIGAIKTYLSNASGYGSLNYSNIINNK